MKNNEYLTSFVDYLKEEGKSEGTIKGYESDVKMFLVFYNKELRNLKHDDINGFRDFLRVERQYKTSSINRKLIGLKQFLSFLNERFELGISTKVRQERVQKKYTLKDDELLTIKDYEKITAVVNETGDLKTKAMFEAMYDTGMRVSEMLQLRIDHVKTRKPVIEDIKGKGNKYREIYPSEELYDTLEAYLKVRKQPYSSTTKLLFVGERGPSTRHAVHAQVKKYAEKAGVDAKKAHAHNFRHLFGKELARLGFTIDEIASLMGHSSIETTRIYLMKSQSHFINKKKKLRG